MKRVRLYSLILLICIVLSSIAGCTSSEVLKNSSAPVASQELSESPTQSGETSSKTVKPDITLSDVDNLTNPNATKEARVLYNYIRDIYGSYCLAGQQESTWNGTPEYEMNYIMEKTGRLPAIRGLDYINEDFDGVTKRAVDWWNKGGIVTICWHWGTPPNGVGYESSKGTIDLDEALTEGTDLYNGMIVQMDRVAEELKKLQDAGVPVLWRPFHEFDGAWFWWGKGGPGDFIKLWQLMYDRYTNYHKLNNLIWVLGYSNKALDGWYPGDQYVDIAGADNYAEGTQIKNFNKVFGYVREGIPLAYHECGPIPDPDAMFRDGATWAWFMTWHTIHIMEQNKPEKVNMIYNHEKIITLDELPDFKAP